MTLKDDDIVTTRAKSRRKFIERAGGALLGAIGVMAVATAAKKKRDAKDFIPRDNKSVDLNSVDRRRDTNVASGDQAN